MQSQEEKLKAFVIPREAKEEILLALKGMQSLVRAGRMMLIPEVGICGNLEKILQEDFTVSTKILNHYLHGHFKTWEDFSGDDAYPIDSGDEDPKDTFNFASAEQMWGEYSSYATARKKLLQHVINEISKELE